MNKGEKNTNSNEEKDVSSQETIVGIKAEEVINQVTSVSGDTQVVDTEQIKGQLSISFEDGNETYVVDDDEDDFSPISNDEEEPQNNDSEQEEKVTDDNQKFDYEIEEMKTKRSITIPVKVKKGILIAAGAAAVLFMAAYVACIVTLPTDTISRNVYIENIDVGGLTYDEALEKISAQTLFKKQTIRLVHGMNYFEIDGASIGLTAGAEETVNKAFNYAKSGNKLKDGLQAVGLLLHKHTVVPAANFDTQKLDEQIAMFGVKCYGELVQHNIVVQADHFTYIGPGCTGFDNNVVIAREQVINALENENFSNIKVALASCPPSDISLAEFDAAVYCDPIDAYFKYVDDTVELVPESIGRYINKEEAEPLLKTVVEGGEPVYIPWYESYAEITAADLEPKLFNSTLGTFSTYYGGDWNRNKNVERASSLMNGAVIPPGEVFSFNDRVGPRSTANGFYTAPEYQNGETVQGIGGGTCQVSTTLYGAVLYAGLDIVSRTNHMFAVSYAPLGQDATVAYGSIDFKFKNNTDYPVQIKSETSGGKITVSLSGTAWEPAREVKLSHSVSDDGLSVVSKRLIYSNGELLKTENLPGSKYKEHKE